MVEKEKYHPILETKSVRIYGRGDKTLIVGEKEFTFQTKNSIIKRKRMKESLINQLENKLFKLSRLKKEGQNVGSLINKTEHILFQAIDKELNTHHHNKTPETIIFREPEMPLESPETIKPYKEDDPCEIKVKKKLKVKDSALWNKTFKKKELKKEIQGQLEDLQEKQFKLDKEKVNPYWEYTFKKPKQDLIGLGDFHYGAATCDVKKIKEKVQKIKESHAAVICMGDLLENANKYSVGAGVYEQVMTPMEQMADVMKLLEPIKKQIMLMIDGNHEFRTWKESAFKPTQIMAEKMGVPYAGWEGFVRMKVKKFIYTVYATHGSTSARFAWTRMKSLEDIMRNVDADIVMMGHTHDKLYHEVRYKGIMEKKKIGVLTGSFLKDDPHGYAAMKNLPPVKTGFVVLELSGTHWDCHGKD